MNDANYTVLIVEDESSIRGFLTINLKRNGFKVLEAESGEQALEIINDSEIDIVILDIMLPGIDGFAVCKKLREALPHIVIVMLTARSEDMDKILGLELGADDYMIKPFNPLELIARIRAVLRRSGTLKKEVTSINCGSLTLDIKSQKFFKNNIQIDLTPTEFLIIKKFMENAGVAISRNDLLDSIWGKNYFGDIKTVDVHIRRLREKIEDNPSKPIYIETVWGMGYRWKKENV